MTRRKRRERRPRRPKFRDVEVRALLEDGASEVAGLRDEIGEWKDNMEGANMEHLPKYEEVSDCFDTLEYEADDIERAVNDLVDAIVNTLDKADKGASDTLLGKTVQVRTGKLRASRADRLAEAMEGIEAALDEVEKAFAVSDGMDPTKHQEYAAILSLCSDIRDHASNLEVVDFPGMY